MNKSFSARNLWVFAASLLALLLLAPTAFAAPDECRGNAAKVVNVNIAEDHAITVDQDTVTIKMHGRVCWEITGLKDGDTLTMAGKTAADDQMNERFAKYPVAFINSGAPNKKGTFHYHLILTNDGKEVSRLDPLVIIEPDT